MQCKEIRVLVLITGCLALLRHAFDVVDQLIRSVVNLPGLSIPKDQCTKCTGIQVL
jgi:hypothetical protein